MAGVVAPAQDRFMSESFCVDFQALGNIPARLTEVRAAITAIDVADAMAGAAATSGPVGDFGIARFGSAFGAFLTAGASAIGDDVQRATQTAANYTTCELGRVRSATDILEALPGS